MCNPKIWIIVWNEFQYEKEGPAVQVAYPEELHGVIAALQEALE